MKLVRDKIPEMMLKEGKSVEIRKARGREYEFMLLKMLQDETEKFLRDRTAENISDIQSVLMHIAEVREIKWEEVEKIMEMKNGEKGGFGKRLILEASK